MQAVYFHGENGQQVVRKRIPESLRESVRFASVNMLERLSLLDDGVMQTILADEVPHEDELRRVIRKATLAHQMTPVLICSAYKNKGVQELLDAITHYLPSPWDREIFGIELDQTFREGSTK